MNLPSRLAAAFVILMALGGASAPAAGARWHWIWLRPAPQGWEVVEGDGVVTFSGDQFSARLVGHASNYAPILIVDGHIRNGQVEATVVQASTDAAPQRYVGEMQSTRTKRSDPANGWGDDWISLRNRGFFLGLHRTIRSTG